MNNPKNSIISVSREEWLEITTDLTADLEEARESWFDQVVEFYEAVTQQEGTANYDFDDLYADEEADNALRGYQLFISMTIVTTNRYINEEYLDDFGDILCAQVCGADYFECMEYYNRFTKTSDLEAWKQILGDAVSQTFIDNNVGEEHLDLVQDMTPLLSIMTMMVAARCFRDDDRVKEYTEMFDNFIGPPEGES